MGALLGLVATASAAPAVTSMSPDLGPATGGTRVTIVGSGFSPASGATRITFGGRSGTAVSCTSTTRCQVTTPNGVGDAPVVITVQNQTNPPGTVFHYTPAVTRLSPSSGSNLGGTVVKIDGAGFLPGATTIMFGANPGLNVTCSSTTSCQATSPNPPERVSVVDVIATVGLRSSPSTSASRFTYVSDPTSPILQSVSPNSGPSIGGTLLTITGNNFSVTGGATKVQFVQDGPFVNATCTLTTRCTVVAPPNAVTVDTLTHLVVRVGTLESLQSAGDGYTYIAPPKVASVTPASGIQSGGTGVTVTGTGFAVGTSATTIKFGAATASVVDCATTTTCTVVSPASLVSGAVNVTATVNGQTSVEDPVDPTINDFTYIEPTEPYIASIAPARGLTTGGANLTITGLRLTRAGYTTSVTFGGTPAAAVTCASATSCSVTTPPHAPGPVDVVVTVTSDADAQVTESNLTPGTYTYFLPVNNPPFAPHSIISFPQRDFVSITGFDLSDAPYTIELRRNGATISQVTGAVPTFDGTDWLMEVNHPGGYCWTGVTPDIDPGSVVRVTGASGIAEETTTAGVAIDGDPVVTGAGPYTVTITGVAFNNGAPIDLGLIEHRFVVLDPQARFLLSNRRTLRASSGGGSDGTLEFTSPGHWKATYVLDALTDKDLAVSGSESRIMWLGADPLAGTEATIYERGTDVFGGPQAPCTAPWEVDNEPPTTPDPFTASQDAEPNLDSVTMTWGASTDNRYVASYKIYRRQVLPEPATGLALIATVSGSKLGYRDLHLQPGTYDYEIEAVDPSGNASARAAVTGIATLAGTAPDLAIAKSHDGSFTIGQTGTYHLTVTNVGTAAASGIITVSDLLPAGLTVASLADSGTGDAMLCANATQAGGRDLVTCTLSGELASGATLKTVDITVNVGVAAAGLVTNTATVALDPAVIDATIDPVLMAPADSVDNNDSASDDVVVDVADPGANVNNPPPAGRAIVAFPARDFVSGEGYDPADRITVQVLRRLPGDSDYSVVAQSRVQQPGADGLLEINHPGGGCWGGSPMDPFGNVLNQPIDQTPNLQPGDKVRYVSAQGWADEVTIAGVSTGRPYNPAPGVIRYHGTAQDADGNPLPIELLEARIIASSADPFDLNDRRAIIAADPAADGSLSYDAQGAIGWTAEFTGLSAHDVQLALDSEARVMYLGAQPLVGNELTIYETGAAPGDVAKGPAAPCTSPADTTTPIIPLPDVAIESTHTGNFEVGTPAQYALKVSNVGSVDTSGTVTVRDTLPAGLNFTGTPNADWACSTSGRVVTCTTDTVLVAGAPAVELVLDLSVANAAVPSVTNDARVETPHDADGANNHDLDVTAVNPAPIQHPDLAIAVTHDRRFTVGITDNSYRITVTNGIATGTPNIPFTGTLSVTDTLPSGMTYASIPADSPWACDAPLGTVVTCTLDATLADGQSAPELRIFVTVDETALGGNAETATVINTATVAPAVDDLIADNTAEDSTVVRAQISSPDVISMIVFPSRDFVSIDGFDMGTDANGDPTFGNPDDGDGKVVVQVWRNGTKVSESAPMTPVDDPSTPNADGIVEVNHLGDNDCWGPATPDIRPGDLIRTVDARGVSYQQTVANVRAAPAVGVDTDGDGELDTVVVHGIATDDAGNRLDAAAFGNLEQRMIALGATNFLSGKRSLRAPGDGELTRSSDPTDIGWTAEYAGLKESDVQLAVAGETRILASPNLLAGNDITIFETGAGTDGGPALAPPCPAPEGPTADLGVTIAQPAGSPAPLADVAQTFEVTVTNHGPDTSSDIALTLALPAKGVKDLDVTSIGAVVSGSGLSRTVIIPALANGASHVVTVTMTPTNPGTVVITASAQADRTVLNPSADPHPLDNPDIAAARIAVL